MHPTDTLLSLSHARIARAAAAGPRRATQPETPAVAQFVVPPAKMATMVVWGAGGGGGGGSQSRSGSVVIEAGKTYTIIVGKAGGAGSCLEADTLNTLARADGILAQRIDAL